MDAIAVARVKLDRMHLREADVFAALYKRLPVEMVMKIWGYVDAYQRWEAAVMDNMLDGWESWDERMADVNNEFKEGRRDFVRGEWLHDEQWIRDVDYETWLYADMEYEFGEMLVQTDSESACFWTAITVYREHPGLFTEALDRAIKSIRQLIAQPTERTPQQPHLRWRITHRNKFLFTTFSKRMGEIAGWLINMRLKGSAAFEELFE